MEAKIREIIAPFIGKDDAGITAETPLDRNALKSSIHVHRMYARLAAQGFEVVDYSTVTNFGDLLRRLSFPLPMGADTSIEQPVLQNKTDGVGIDIEEIASLPSANDYRTHEFYVSNFTSEEISHCILQTNPRVSFSGLFAAKEAIMKADNGMKKMLFNTVSIQHTQEGKPYYSGFEISISHTDTVAVAVAFLKSRNSSDEPVNVKNMVVERPNQNLSLVIAVIALIIAMLTIVVELKRG